MMRKISLFLICAAAAVLPAAIAARGQNIQARPVDRWLTMTGVAAGTDLKAKDEAVAQALRKAVEQVCGVFLTAQSKTRDYKAVYDKIFANTVGYVREHEVLKTWTDGQQTFAKVKVRVSTQRFEEDWAVIAHTIEQENNPRVIVAVVEAIHHSTTGPVYEVKNHGIVQGKIEDFFLEKGVALMDREMAAAVNKRDILLAAIRDDTQAVAALGSRFNADVVVLGRAVAKYGKEIEVGGQDMYQYTATVNVRVIQTDSARILASKSFGPATISTLQRGGGEDKALAKLAEDSAPKLLTAVVEAWRKRANVSRTVDVRISGMDFKAWKKFKAEIEELRGVEASRLREIVESVACIDIEYRYTNENLAEHLTELEGIKLEVTEITANRVKLKVVDVD